MESTVVCMFTLAIDLVFCVLLVLLIKTDGSTIVPLDTILPYVMHTWNAVNLVLVGYLVYLTLRNKGTNEFKSKYYDISIDRAEGKR